MFDSDKSNTLDLKEINEKFGIGSYLDSQLLNEIIKKVDKDHDGLVNINIYYIRYQ